MTKTLGADEIINIALRKQHSKSTKAISVKLTGLDATFFHFLTQQGYKNSSRKLKLGLSLLSFLVAQEKLGTPVLIGPNDRGIPPETPLLTVLDDS